MARIKVNTIAPITLTSIADYSIDGVLNLPLVQIQGTYKDKRGFAQQTPVDTSIEIIVPPWQVMWYSET